MTKSQGGEAITGIQALQGEGVHVSQGFWADAWERVVKRPGAIMGMAWIGIVSFFAVFAPVLASGHPLVMWELNAAGERGAMTSPLLQHLSTTDWLILIWSVVCTIGLVLPLGIKRSRKLAWIIFLSLQTVATVIVAAGIKGFFGKRDAADWARELEQSDFFIMGAAALSALVCALFFLLAPTSRTIWKRAIFVTIVGAVSGITMFQTWETPPPTFQYMQRERERKIEAIYTLVPWSPSQRLSDRSTLRLEPGNSAGSALAETLTIDLPLMGPIGDDGVADVLSGIDRLPLQAAEKATAKEEFRAWVEGARTIQTEITSENAGDALRDIMRPFGRSFRVGTDTLGQDVASQMMHASRLSVSIGLVSTGIAVVIGVTLGALMGYFGGKVDLILYRVVEIFMAIPVLFMLIVVAGVLPRNTYVMMAIIGCFTWHFSARYTRAEFLKLRNQDFVQSARAAGLPLRSILFKHMLPNGVTPVLVDSSFRIALAIQFEAILSFLGLGPVDQPSWGRLLSDAAGDAGAFAPWLAIFPGLAIFLTVLAYNLLGESLRDAIDPKLRKARV